MNFLSPVGVAALLGAGGVVRTGDFYRCDTLDLGVSAEVDAANLSRDTDAVSSGSV